MALIYLLVSKTGRTQKAWKHKILYMKLLSILLSRAGPGPGALACGNIESVSEIATEDYSSQDAFQEEREMHNLYRL